jgi:ABC-2 type transport system ATP-binding protein
LADRGSAPASPANAVSVAGLTKVYRAQGKRPGGGEKTALDRVDLDIPRGSLFALLGPNGAGKSTLINILAGLVLKSAGTARVWDIDIDRDPRGARAAIGVVPQELNIDPFFTPRALLELQAGMYGVPKAERRTMEILDAVGLTDRADVYPRTLSGGMRRRLLVAKAMVHDPPVLVLDEPTAGVDVELRQSLWAFIRKLNADGHTIMLTTHYLEEAEALCSRIAMLKAGRIVALDTTQNLLSRFAGLTVRLAAERVPAAWEARVQRREGGVYILGLVDYADLERLLAALREARIVIGELSLVEADLEQVFLRIMHGVPERASA